MAEKVIVISNTSGEVQIDLPELRLKRVWTKKGAKLPIELETLKEALYDPGVNYMFTHGLLYIEDMSAKKELELEPEDAETPQNIIVLSDDQKERYLNRLPHRDFVIAFGKLSPNEQVSLAEYAIEHNINILENKNQIIMAATHIDVNRVIKESLAV